MSRHGRWSRAASSVEDGIFGRIFKSYGRISDAWRRGAIYGAFSGTRTSRVMARARRGISRSVEGSFILRAARAMLSSLPWLTLRSYGVFFLSFGLYTSIIFAIKALATTITAETDALISGAMMMIVSIPLLFSRKTLAEAVTLSTAVSYIAFDVLGFRRDDAGLAKKPRGRLDTPFLAGMIAGLSTFFFEPERVMLFFLAAVVLFVSAAKPETGLLLVFALFPFFGDGQLVCFILILAASYLLKYFCGRRTMRFDPADAVMAIFFVLVIFGDIVHYGRGAGIHGSLRRAAFMTVYFLTVNLMANKEWRERLVKSMIFGGTALAAVGIVSFFLDRITPLDVSGSGVLADVTAWVGRVADNAGASSYYLAMMLPVMTAYLIRHGIGKKRLTVAFFTAAAAAAAVLTMSRGLLLGAAAGMFLFLAVCDIRFLLLPTAAAVGLPAAMIFLPDAARDQLAALLDLSGSAAIRRVFERRLSGKIFIDNFIGGIGSADGVFSAVFGTYSPIGSSADNAQNLFLGIGTQLGASGLLVFLIAMLLLLIKSFTHAAHTDARGDRMPIAFAAGIFAALVAGMSNYIWIDDRMFLLFFMFAGAASAFDAEAVGNADDLDRHALTEQSGASASVDIVFTKRH